MKYTHPFGDGNLLNTYDFSPGHQFNVPDDFFNSPIASHKRGILGEDFFVVIYGDYGLSLCVDWLDSVRKGKFRIWVFSQGTDYEFYTYYRKETRKKRELLEYIYQAHLVVLKIIDGIDNKGMSKEDFIIEVE